jgi:hypothetical protein
LNIDDDLKSEILAELRKVRAPAKAARNLGLDLRLVLQVSDEIGGMGRNSRVEQYDGWGRPSWQPFIVARKRAHQAWDNTIPEIAKARLDYEAGTHNMCTGRDGDWLILYSKPQARVTPRPDYFKPEF